MIFCHIDHWLSNIVYYYIEYIDLCGTPSTFDVILSSASKLLVNPAVCNSNPKITN